MLGMNRLSLLESLSIVIAAVTPLRWLLQPAIRPVYLYWRTVGGEKVLRQSHFHIVAFHARLLGSAARALVALTHETIVFRFALECAASRPGHHAAQISEPVQSHLHRGGPAARRR